MNGSLGIQKISVALKVWFCQKRCFGNQTFMFLRRKYIKMIYLDNHLNWWLVKNWEKLHCGKISNVWFAWFNFLWHKTHFTWHVKNVIDQHVLVQKRKMDHWTHICILLMMEMWGWKMTIRLSAPAQWMYTNFLLILKHATSQCLQLITQVRAQLKSKYSLKIKMHDVTDNYFNVGR